VKHVTDYLEKDKVNLLLEAAAMSSTRDYLMLRVLWRTGMRVSELLNIHPSDIERANNVVNVTRAKGGKERRVPLDPETVSVLSDYVLEHEIPPEDKPIFATTQQQVRNLVTRYSKSVGLRAHPHLEIPLSVRDTARHVR
jgi:integrase